MSSRKKGNSSAVFAVVFVVFIVVFIIGFMIAYSASSDSDDNIIDTSYHYEKMDVSVEWNNDRSCSITYDLSVVFDKSGKHGIYYDIPVNSGEKIRDLEVNCKSPCKYSHEANNKIVRIRIGDEDRTFSYGDTLNVRLSYDYITPVHPSDADILALAVIGYGHKCYTENATVTVTYPSAPASLDGEFGVFISGKRLGLDDSRVKWNSTGTQIVVSVGALQPFKGVEVAYKMPTGVLVNRVDTEFIVTLVIGIVLLAVTVLVKVFAAKNKPLTPIVDFYPPRIDTPSGVKRHMLPVQMGKLIDDFCSLDDVTSLIFYWASKGYLLIDEREDGIYLRNTTLEAKPTVNVANIDPFDDSPVPKVKADDVVYKKFEAVTDYEKDLFDSLFAYSEPDEKPGQWVAMSRLKGSFSKVMEKTRTAASKEYTGKLYSKPINKVSKLLSVLCALYAAAICVFTSCRIRPWFFNLIGVIIAIVPIIAMIPGASLARNRFKFSGKKSALLTALFIAAVTAISFGIIMFMPSDVMGYAEKIILALFVSAVSSLSPFIMRRTPFYNEQLESILGFRTFLRDAEKDRLETLIADDPQYYYNILPYANVLGVSDVWSDKFKDLTVEPPSYYSSYDGSLLFDLIVFDRLAHSVSSDLTYVPPSSSGSFSGGGFSGGGGGGFSGGSFGGGGSGSW